MRTLFFTLFLLFSCTPRAGKEPLTFSFFALNTSNQLQFYEQEHAVNDYEEIANLAKKQIQQVERWFNAYDGNSTISQLNSRGSAIVSQAFIDVLEEAMNMAALSQGRFDPTIRPLVELWQIGSEDAILPSKEEIERLLPLVDYQQLSLDVSRGQVSFEQMGMALDLGALAKGYAADRLRLLFKEKGVENALINLGGNIVIMGSKTNAEPWRIALRSGTRSEENYAMELELRVPLAISTSGIYEQFFEEGGVLYHHILDATTGYPVLNNLASVSVFDSDSSLEADSLSTALFTLGLEEALKEAENLDIEAIFVTREKEIVFTSGINKPGSNIKITKLAANYRYLEEK